MSYKEFSLSVIEKLDYYVYLLIEPITNKVFYVGKGNGNRIFQHLKEAEKSLSKYEKLDVIREIHNQGNQVRCLIHRHGLTEKEAFEVESSLIDFIGLEELSNRARGHKSEQHGQMNVIDITAKYDAPLVEINEPVILFNLPKTYWKGISEEELFKATHRAWNVGIGRENVKYAFAVNNLVIRQVYSIEGWYPDTEHTHLWAFNGKIASNLQHYIGKSVANYISEGFRFRFRFKYINCK